MSPKNLIRKCIILLLLVCLSVNTSLAGIDPNADQSYHSKVIPPAPTVSSLGKYGNVPVNLSTGAINFSVPLYELKVKNATLPISLSYSSNGIKVDAIASWVGMEWSLFAGGVISRMVRGGPDENSTCNIPAGLEEYSPSTVDFLQYSWDHTTDTEPDIFQYNFNGYTGKFIIDFKNTQIIAGDTVFKVYCVPYNNLKIKVNYLTSNIGIYSFVITTPDGTKYTFGENFSDTTLRPIECHYKTYNRGMKTAWHLKRIDYPAGERISFSYKTKIIHFYTGIAQTLKKLTHWTCVDNSCPDDEEYTCTQKLTTRTYHLEKITSSYGDSIYFYSNDNRLDSEDFKLDSLSIFNSLHTLIKTITFNYNFPSAHGHTYNNIDNFYVFKPDLKHRMFLLGVKINGAGCGSEQKYSFDYKDSTQLPGRLSFSQDHWGYYNAEYNYDFVVVPEHLTNHPDFATIRCKRDPALGKAETGLLKKVRYPTGGTSDFEYEQNSYSATELVYPPIITISNEIRGLNCYDPDTTYESFSVPYTQNQMVGASLTFDSTELCGYMKNRHIGKISVFDNTTSTYLVTQKIVRLNKPISIPVVYDSGHVYTATIIACGMGTETLFYTGYFATKPQNMMVSKIAGGMRIKKVIDHDNITGKTKTIRYFYGELSNLTESSGVIGSIPRYTSSQTIKKLCNLSMVDECNYCILNSNSVNDLFNLNGNSIMYTNVVKSYGDYFENGGESNKFFVELDDPGLILAWDVNTNGNYILNAPLNNAGWNNGELEEQIIFKYQNELFVPVKKTTYGSL